MTSTLRPFTSESVTEGHPDKVCDQISDAILDAILEQDTEARVAVETMVTTGLVHVAGEITTEAYVEIPQIIRETVREIGYDSSAFGFDGDSVGVSVSIGQQSPDIGGGVDKSSKSAQPARWMIRSRSRVRVTRASCSATPAPTPRTHATSHLGGARSPANSPRYARTGRSASSARTARRR